MLKDCPTEDWFRWKSVCVESTALPTLHASPSYSRRHDLKDAFVDPHFLFYTTLTQRITMALPSLASRVSLLSKLSLNRTTPLATLPQVRTQWFQDEVRSHRDPVTGKWRYEEPTMTIQRFRFMKTSEYLVTLYLVVFVMRLSTHLTCFLLMMH
jgi:hypothetical protein